MTKYPQGGERQLIYAVTKRAINSKMLPADAGCIVDNVATMVAVYHAVKEGKPVTSRIFTVTGDAVVDPGNFEFLIGTSFQELLDAAGGFKEQPEKIISGGPMMGFSMFGLDVPTTKTTSALLCMTKEQHVSTAAAVWKHVRSRLFHPDCLNSQSMVTWQDLKNGMVLSAWNVEAAVLSARQNVR